MDITTWFLALDPTLLPLGALVTLTVVSLIRGWVIPRQVHLDRMQDLLTQIKMLVTERDDWKTAFMTSEKAKADLIKQNSDLVDAAETTNRLIESLRNHIERIDSSQRQIER